MSRSSKIRVFKKGDYPKTFGSANLLILTDKHLYTFCEEVSLPKHATKNWTKEEIFEYYYFVYDLAKFKVFSLTDYSKGAHLQIAFNETQRFGMLLYEMQLEQLLTHPVEAIRFHAKKFINGNYPE